MPVEARVLLFDRFRRDARRVPLVRGPVASAGGLRGPAGIHLRGLSKELILRRFQAFRGGFRAGWTPKKIALTLAKLRAAPPSIPLRHEGTRTTTQDHPARLLDSGLDSGWIPESSPDALSRPPHLVRACQGFSALNRSCHVFRCLAEKCLAIPKSLDRLTARRGRSHTASTASWVASCRSAARQSPPAHTHADGSQRHG